ncbi:MAG: hypothetical protein LBK27_07420, partial [Treponema sp.]|nr:hypothetical protein [Treponema sp.]
QGGNAGDPFTAAPGTEAPEGFAEFRRGAVLALWLTDPGPPANRFFAVLGLPLQLPAEQLFVSLFPHTGEGEGAAAAEPVYEALIRIQTPAASQARALFTLINMAASALQTAELADGPAVLAGIFFARPPTLDGRNLNLRTAAMDAAQIALLFSLFPVYSD